MALGDRFSGSHLVTTETITRGAELIGDFNPLHVDETFAKASLYKDRVLHGVLTSSIMTAPVGNSFHGTTIAYTEHNCRLIRPVYAGDTLNTVWTVTDLLPKPSHQGGVISMTGVARNQNKQIVARVKGKILVKSADHHDHVTSPESVEDTKDSSEYDSEHSRTSCPN